MASLKPSKDQLNRKFAVDDIPRIDVYSERKTLNSTLEAINSILQHGESHLKLECVERIMYGGYIDDPKQAKKYTKAVIKTKVLETMLTLMKYEDYNDLILKNDDTRKLNIEMATCMMALTNTHGALGEIIAEAGGISYFTDICRFKPFLDNLENPHIYEFIEAIVATLHNIARLSSVSQYVSDSKTAEAMVPLFSCKKERLQIYATLAAAQTCDDSKIHMLVDAEGVISSMLKYLSKATHYSDYCYQGASLMELLDGIDKLACADPNKKKILEAGALPIFETILNLDKPEEQALTERVLWTLTFDDDVASDVKSSKTLLNRLEILSKSSDKAVRNNAKGLLYNINSHLKKEKTDIALIDDTIVNQKGKHLFISYSWNEKEIVLKLKDLLQEKRIPIWIDTEKMRGSTLEAMAEAVENAALVLICMSESYKHSPNCRLESENTFRCGKDYIPLIVQKHYKPDGWLGALLGAKLYIDFSGKYQFEPKWSELIKELQAFQILNEGGESIDTSKEYKENNRISIFEYIIVVAKPDLSSSSTNPNTFTINDVKQWLTLQKLENCCHHFENVNGKGLLQLKSMRHDAPEFYFKTLSRKLKLSLGEILNFSAALDEL